MYTCERCNNRLTDGEGGICDTCKNELMEARSELEEYGIYLDD